MPLPVPEISEGAAPSQKVSLDVKGQLYGINTTPKKTIVKKNIEPV
jgi:hypothetical protein